MNIRIITGMITEKFKEKKSCLVTDTFWMWSGLALVWAMVFLPHVFFNGFIIDDWSVVKQGVVIPKFWDLYASWFPLFSNRPAAPLVISIAAKLCGENPMGYIIAGLAIWLSSLLIIANILRKVFSKRCMFVFLLLASFPSIASTAIFSIGMQLVGVTSIFLWAISFYCLDKFIHKKNIVFLTVSFFAILLSLTIYEITLPFLIINLLYPLLFNKTYNFKSLKLYFTKFILPILGILLLVLVFQKIVMPSFMTVYSRLEINSFSVSLGIFLSWFWALLVDFPVLLVDALRLVLLGNPNSIDLKIIFLIVSVLAGLLVFADGISFFKCENEYREKEARRSKFLFLGLIVLALLSSSLLYVLSGGSPRVGGYGNRGLTATWILLSMTLGVATDIFRYRRLHVIVLVVIILNICSFMLQRENYSKSWSLQIDIAQSVANKLKEIEQPLEKISLLGHVPWFVPYNYNNEEVFQNFWDFSGAIWYVDRSLDINAMPLNPVNIKNIKIEFDKVSLAYWQTGYSNLWFFEYNELSGRSRLQKISNETEMKAVAKQVSVADFNRFITPMSVIIRDKINNSISLNALLLVFLAYSLLFFMACNNQTIKHANHIPAIDVIPGNPCRVCGSLLFRRFRDSDQNPEDLSPDDYKATDSNYGTTLAIECCAGCGFLQCNCNDVLKYYEQMQDPEYEAGRLARTKQFQMLLKELSSWVAGGRLLDVGAGTGVLVEQALACGFDAEGIEPSEWMVREAKANGLQVISGVLPDRRLDAYYQAITLVDVIEHVSAPAEILDAVYNLLAPDGYLLIVTPNVSSLAAKLFGSRWWHFRIAHINYFSPHTINLLLQRCGFEVVKEKHAGWYFELNYLLERLSTFIPGNPAIVLPEFLSRVIIPLNLFDSMLLVCRKKQ